jgi:hypothetical protein
MIHSIGFWICMFLICVLIGLLIYGFFHNDKCPHCGSKNTSLQFIEATNSCGIWHMTCNKCGKKFIIKI